MAIIETPPSFAELQGTTTKTVDRLKYILRDIRNNPRDASYVDIVPFLFSLKGKPYSLKDYYVFDPMFRCHQPSKRLLITGRQVAKTSTLGLLAVILMRCVDHRAALCLSPLFDQTRRFSQERVAPLIAESHCQSLLVDSSCVQNVLTREFVNKSKLTFSYCFLDAERTRGNSADYNFYDEIQDMDISFIPVVQETMSASKIAQSIFAGTPKTLDNTINKLKEDSSYAEWVIKCHHGGCGEYNVPSLDHHLDAMTGPIHTDIGPNRAGIVCHKCQKPLLPRPKRQGGFGRWVHRYPDRREHFAGYHIPQQIMPLHYADPKKWAELLDKKALNGGVTEATYYNEVCGESFDRGAKLLTLTELLETANLPWNNVFEEARARIGHYQYRFLCVDWGGGGTYQGKADLKFQSYTTAAVIGFNGEGTFDVIYAWRSQEPHNHIGEAQEVGRLIHEFRCHKLAHDFSGAGATRESILLQLGLPPDIMVPVKFTGITKGEVMKWKTTSGDTGERPHFSMDKARAINYVCMYIKYGFVRFFQDDYENSQNLGILRDFMNIIEDKGQSSSGQEYYKILKDPNGPDDFVSAVVLGVMALCEATNYYPDLSINPGILSKLDGMQSMAELYIGKENW